MSARSDLERALRGTLPSELVVRLLDSYEGLLRRYCSADFEPSELSAGKFSEAAFRILEFAESHTYTPLGHHLQTDPIRLRLENLPRGSLEDSFRLYIPRLLRSAVDIRNSRGVGHLPGQVNHNYMDATLVLSICAWVLAEFVRVYHTQDATQAQRLVDGLVSRPIPLIFDLGYVKRVLDPGLTARDQVLCLAYGAEPDWIGEQELLCSTEYGNPSRFRANILAKLHHERKIEWDRGARRVRILPPGSRWVEQNIDLRLPGA